MFHIPDSKSSFYSFLQKIDQDTVAAMQATPCIFCNDQLDRADYLRKPRGVPDGIDEDFSVKYGLCCRREGCRKRTTPASVRFYGRRVFLLFFMVLSTSVSESGCSRVAATMGVSRQTLANWRHFWREVFPQTALWRQKRGLLTFPPQPETLPGSLVEQLAGKLSNAESLIPALKFIAIG